jgi:hypothetical protein
MAERLPDIKKGDSLPTNDDVYRICITTDRDKKAENIPATKSFTLSTPDKDDNYRLSVDWAKKTTPEEVLIREGIRYKSNTQIYKNYLLREIFALNVGFLKSLSEIKDVIYDPTILEKFVKGKPDNPAHSSVLFSPENYEQYESEITLKIREHAKDKFVNVDIETVKKEVEKLRALNDIVSPDEKGPI